SLCDDIAWSIWDVYRKSNEYTSGRNGQALGSGLHQLFQAVEQENLRPVIITTNYDLIIEKLTTLWIPNDPWGGQVNVEKWAYFYPGFEVPAKSDQALLQPKNEKPNPKQKWIPV